MSRPVTSFRFSSTFPRCPTLFWGYLRNRSAAEFFALNYTGASTSFLSRLTVHCSTGCYPGFDLKCLRQFTTGHHYVEFGGKPTHLRAQM